MSEKVITPERYKELLKMLQAPDEETKLLALKLIRNMPFKPNLAYILVLKKQSYTTAKMWTNGVPQLAEFYKKNNKNMEHPVYYKEIVDLLTDNKAPLEQVQIAMDFFAEYFGRNLNEEGYTDVESVTIKINVAKPAKS